MPRASRSWPSPATTPELPTPRNGGSSLQVKLCTRNGFQSLLTVEQADTKFEFGLDEETDEIYLVDEVLTYVASSPGLPGSDTDALF